MKLTIVVPAYNEEENIADIIESIEAAVRTPHEVVVVNDHSTDNTRQLILKLGQKYANLKLVDNRRDRGFANAFRSGFDNVSTDFAIPVMADLCDDLTTIDTMFARTNEGYDIVCGCRYAKGGARRGGSKVKGFFSFFVGGSLYLLLGIPTHDVANAFKLYRKAVLDSIKITAKGFEISMEITLKGFFKGFKITEVPTVWKERTKGKSSFKMLRLFPAYFRLYLWAILRSLTG